MDAYSILRRGNDPLIRCRSFTFVQDSKWVQCRQEDGYIIIPASDVKAIVYTSPVLEEPVRLEATAR